MVADASLTALANTKGHSLYIRTASTPLQLPLPSSDFQIPICFCFSAFPAHHHRGGSVLPLEHILTLQGMRCPLGRRVSRRRIPSHISSIMSVSNSSDERALRVRIEAMEMRLVSTAPQPGPHSSYRRNSHTGSIHWTINMQ